MIKSPSIESQSQLEQHLAQQLFLLGETLKQGQPCEEASIVALHDTLDALTQTPRFVQLQQLFRLSAMELKFLALVYIQTQDPDAITPFLGLSWYEQGPTISLDKLLTLSDRLLDKRNMLN